MIDCDRIQISKNMGAVRVKVKLTNAIDEELVKRGLLISSSKGTLSNRYKLSLKGSANFARPRESLAN